MTVRYSEAERIRMAHSAMVALAQRTSYAEVSEQFTIPEWRLLQWALEAPSSAAAS